MNLKKALEIQLRSLPNYHMDLASNYSIISHVYHDMTDYEQGLSYCEKALDIYQRCLRRNHPSLATVHTNMANNLGELKRFDKAIFHAKEAIEISRLYLPSDHKDIKERERILHALQTTQKYYQNSTMNNSE
jgi:tetratricopeptide (TPR) repeat protein